MYIDQSFYRVFNIFYTGIANYKKNRKYSKAENKCRCTVNYTGSEKSEKVQCFISRGKQSSLCYLLQ
jgi:hypothetical protein